MKHLLILSPILLAACVQHQDPCVTSRPPCNPLIEDCICEYSGQDSDRDGSGVGGDRVTPPSGDDGGSEGSGPSDDSNGGVSDETSDKNEDRPSKDHSDHNGGDSGSSDENGSSSEGGSDE